MNRNWMVIGILTAALAAMVVAGVHYQHSPARSSAALGGSVNGKPAPDFALVDIKSGKTVHLSDFKGKPVLLNFWATWCPPCKVEIPWFVDLQKQYSAQGLTVIGVAMDDAGRDTIAKFVDDFGINYTVLQGTEKVSDEYGGVEALPTTFYIGRDGKVAKRVFGLASHGEIEENVKSMMKTAQAGTNDSGQATTATAQYTGSR